MTASDYITHAEIRQRAHQLWEQAARPDGKDVEHWLAAEQQLRDERDALDDAPVAPAVRR